MLGISLGATIETQPSRSPWLDRGPSWPRLLARLRHTIEAWRRACLCADSEIVSAALTSIILSASRRARHWRCHGQP